MERRAVLAGLGGGLAATGWGRLARAAGVPGLDPLLPDGTRQEAVMAALPGKQPLIKLSFRPPNYETPLSAFGEAITPNDRFFVRYHLSDIPEMAELQRGWTLRVGGDAAGHPLELSIDRLREDYEPVEIAAVNQCSGNRRGLSAPHVPGVQWGSGAMGCAVWRGARLRDVLARAGVKPGAVEVAFAGADGPPLAATPKLRKSLPVAKAMEENVLIAYAMNGEAPPHLNGFPLRLVVPGWTGVYWMKHLDAIEIRSQPLGGFWMEKAYRVPAGMFPVELPFTTQAKAATVPITEMVVNAAIAEPIEGSRQPAAGFTVTGVAWDRGHGIERVEVSADGGATWAAAALGPDGGNFAFRPWRWRTGALPAGRAVLRARAINRAGETQPAELKRNPAGYHNNVPVTVTVAVA